VDGLFLSCDTESRRLLKEIVFRPVNYLSKIDEFPTGFFPITGMEVNL